MAFLFRTLFPLVILVPAVTLNAQSIAWKVTDVTNNQAITNNQVRLDGTSEPAVNKQPATYKLIKIEAPTPTRVDVNVSPNTSAVGNWLRYAPAPSGAATNCAGSVAYNTYPTAFQTQTPVYLCVAGPRDAQNNNTLPRGYYASFISFTPPSGSRLTIQIRLTVVPNGYLQLSSTCTPDATCSQTNNGDLNTTPLTFTVSNSSAGPAKLAYAVLFAPDDPRSDPFGDPKSQLNKPLLISVTDKDGAPASWVSVSFFNLVPGAAQSSPLSPTRLQVGVDPSKLPSGQEDVSANIRITAGAAYQGDANLSVNTHVNLPAATLSADAGSIDFSYPNGTISQIVNPRSSGAPIAYSATATSNDGTNWLAVTPANGNTPTPITVSATVSSARPPGTYTGSVTIAPTNIAAGSVTIPVTLIVNPVTTVFGIGGTISDARGACSSGVTVALTGAGSLSTVTASNGTYNFSSVPGGVSVITPSKAGCTFNPPSITINVNGNSANNNFAGAGNVLTLVYPTNGATAILPTSTLTWSAFQGASSYDVYFGVGTPQLVANVTGTSWQMSGSNTNVTYTWRVVAKSGSSTLSTSDNWTFTTGSASTNAGLYFIPVTPCHLVDTRPSQASTGPFGPPILEGGETRTFYPPSGSCPGIPASAKAYSLTVTARPTNLMPFLTIWPAGQPRPNASTLNAFQGGTVSNAAFVPAGDGGGVSVYVTDQAHVALDINGYFDSAATGSATAFHTLPPCRIADTRNPNGTYGGPRLAARSSRDFPLATSNCVPAQANAAAYSLNVTVVPAEPLDYVVAFPANIAQPPSVITLGSPMGAVVADATIVQGASPNGTVRVFASNATDVLFDVNGYFGSRTTAGALVFHPLAPCRVVDTRDPTIRPLGGPIMAADTVRTFPVGSSPCNIPLGALAYSLNVTVAPAGVLSFVTLWPTGQARPLVSTLNDFAGVTLANAAIVPVGQGDSINVYVTDRTHVILDINGYFSVQ